MNLQNLYDQLTTGELAQVSMSNNSKGFTVENQKRILPQINLGLTALHTRFLLRERRVTFNKREGVHIHHINDASFLRLEKVTSPSGATISIDREDRKESVFMDSWNEVRFPAELAEGAYELVYRIDHDKIKPEWIDLLGAEKIALPIPSNMLYPLGLFIAGQLLTPMGFDGEMHEGNNYVKKYEMAVRELEERGFKRQIEIETPNFENNGWV